MGRPVEARPPRMPTSNSYPAQGSSVNMIYSPYSPTTPVYPTQSWPSSPQAQLQPQIAPYPYQGLYGQSYPSHFQPGAFSHSPRPWWVPAPPTLRSDNVSFAAETLQENDETLQPVPEATNSPPRSPPPEDEPLSRRAQKRLAAQRPRPRRTQWVMWVGNLPSRIDEHELWRFFNYPPHLPEGETSAGVVSIFLIPRSNCAFLNFDNEEHLKSSVERHNGTAIHPEDTLCPDLVCRIRSQEDEEKAGVGAQRGAGIHREWLKKTKEEAKIIRVPGEPRELVAPKPRPADAIAKLHEEAKSEKLAESSGEPQTESSINFSATNSSMLIRHFPKRYFIMKSLTKQDLDNSVKIGIWSTQKHNETTLDQAFRTSKDVFLIFSENKSRGFYGYGRMTSRIFDVKQYQAVAQSSQGSSKGGSTSSLLSVKEDTQRTQVKSPTPMSREESHHEVSQDDYPEGSKWTPAKEGESSSTSHSPQEDPERSMVKSTMPMSPEESNHEIPEVDHADPSEPYVEERPCRSAPPELYSRHRRISLNNQPDLFRSHDDLDVPADYPPPSLSMSQNGDAMSSAHVEDGVVKAEKPLDHQPSKQATRIPFMVEWIKVHRLPFNKTRHMRNHFNNNREIKICRDGTEVDPVTGEQLLEEWNSI